MRQNTRADIAEQAAVLLNDYLKTVKRIPNRLNNWYAAAYWITQRRYGCDQRYTQIELARKFNVSEHATVSKNAKKIEQRMGMIE